MYNGPLEVCMQKTPEFHENRFRPSLRREQASFFLCEGRWPDDYAAADILAAV